MSFKGGFKEAQSLFRDVQQEMAEIRGVPIDAGESFLNNGQKRIYATFFDGTNVQIRPQGKSGHIKLEIKDVQKNIYEKITFKQGGQ